ncbi:hypothetical protein [Shewanella algae]|uniref:hypothetical protein n=1 Tax=Shewanella algae TaxID=38313 RepID=UPI001C5895FB|nr:hypothetical protein [Shewanella algae]
MNTILQLAINEASAQYGMPTHTRTILPVKFRAVGGPDCTYPTSDTIQVTIRDYCQTDMESAHYQLSHEAVHTLSPVDKPDVTVLEEGVATLFSHEFLVKHTGTYWDSSGDQRYDDACALVRRLIAVETNAISILFGKYQTLSHLTAQNIIDAIPAVNGALADSLVRKFNP